MKNLLMTTALVMFAAGPVAAQAIVATENTNLSAAYMAGDMNISVENMLDKEVYVQREGVAADPNMDLTMGINDAPDTWDNVGEIGDVMLSKDGEVDSVIVDAGGFLGMGERNTRISMDQLQFVRDSNEDGAFFVVFTGNRAALEGNDEYDADMMRTEGYMSSREANMGAVGTQRYGNDDYALARDNRQTWEQADWSAMTTEDLTGVQVNGSNDDWVGEISELVLDADGKTITNAIIDVGGWLGMGERPVSIPFDQIELRRNGSNIVAYIDATEDQLEGMPEWTN
jgi:sporulation protein YlmC with PRC-barrel domain